jgi:hypothetical protein
MGGISQPNQIGDILSTPLLSAYVTLANLVATFTNPGGTATTFIIASVKLLQLITVYRSFMDNISDSQRRRLTGRGQ